MEQNLISKIIRKYLRGRFSSETEERVQKWIIQDKYTKEKTGASLEYWNELVVEADADTHAALKRVNRRILKKVPLHRKLSRVAAILLPLFILAGGYFYYESTQERLIEISVAYGEEKHLFLPDNTEVWLNAGTTFRYPKTYKNNQRLIYLEGEGYFSVTKNEACPFIVETRQLSVKVLGTQFNIKAYPEDEKAVTTLTSGKIEVTTGSKESCILSPNEQLTYNNSTAAIEVNKVSPQESKGWITGQIIFYASSFEEIIRTLERRFNISIGNNTTIPSSNLYTIKFLKEEKPEDILDFLKELTPFSYTKEGNKIILTDN
ncbi:MAG: FecR family protein [Tannerellaceae bacterium]|nr:FecR family protein [Tannerellaceae bacterium]